eukprot:TRINITY_DN2797_c0_g1_i1.p1 TRINITY_DN2797_c0_g1~~TRINITY_DN2797_c0_g1_i1.p1  ORF type:complete len:428 (-),score=65.27 TRINITY_DN2797_c0_g1_i1:128-1411(-)
MWLATTIMAWGLLGGAVSSWACWSKQKLRWYQHPVTLLCAFISVVMLSTIWEFGDVHVFGKTVRFVNEPECLLDEPTINLETNPVVLVLAWLAPLWVVGTFIVTAFNVARHMRHNTQRYATEAIADHPNRFFTLWIILLPIVYGLAAFCAVTASLSEERLRDVKVCESERAAYRFRAETALCFGDIYEGIALLIFAQLTLRVIKSKVDWWVKKSEHDASDLESHLLSQYAGQEVVTDVRTMDHVAKKLFGSTSQLTMLGVQYFCVVCFLMGFPKMLAAQFQAYGMEACATWLTGRITATAPALYGAGYLGSCIAIHNVVAIEQDFGEEFLTKYRPTMKFISVKIMVTIVFIQESGIPLITGLSETRATVLDASLRVLEFFLISIFNLYAWRVDENWLEMLVETNEEEPEVTKEICPELEKGGNIVAE